MKLEFSRQIFENPQISNLIKIRSVGAQLFQAGGRADGQTDMTKLIVAFLNFANALKNSTWCSRCIYVFCADLRTKNL